MGDKLMFKALEHKFADSEHTFTVYEHKKIIQDFFEGIAPHIIFSRRVWKYFVPARLMTFTR